MNQRTVAVIAGGLRQPSSTRLLADRIAAAAVEAAAARGIQLEVKTIELRDLAHDITNHLLTGFPPAALKTALDTVAEADGLIAVSPIFTASYSGLFKSFVDVIDKDALTDKPVVLGATAGTARHSLTTEHAMRPLFTYLRAVVVPTAVFAATDDFGADSADGTLQSRIDRAATELARELEHREPVSVLDPFALSANFQDLLD
nr:FMN reductase [uncultured Actinoplanes sp.]